MRTDEVLALLEAFEPGSDAQAVACLEETVRLVRAVPDPFSRAQYAPGHLTASAIVLSPKRERVLLVFHERLGRWLQPGGHVEPHDRSVRDTAAREVLEECGIEVFGHGAPLVAVDVHHIPAGRGEPAHRHYDLMFGFRISERRAREQLGEGTRWCPITEVVSRTEDAAVVRGIHRALACDHL